MSKQDLQELTERLLNGSYRPLDPQEAAEEDRQLHAARTQLEQILREAPVGTAVYLRGRR